MPLQAESSVSNDICATKGQIGRPSTNQAISIGCHNNHHVYVTLRVIPPTSPSPTLFAHAESVHCVV